MLSEIIHCVYCLSHFGMPSCCSSDRSSLGSIPWILHGLMAAVKIVEPREITNSCYGPLVLYFLNRGSVPPDIYIYIFKITLISSYHRLLFSTHRKKNEKLGSPGELFQSRLLPGPRLKNEDKFLWCFVLLFSFLESCLSTSFWHLLELLSTIPPRYQAYQCRQVPQISECVT